MRNKSKLFKKIIAISVTVILGVLTAFGVVAYNAKFTETTVNEISASKMNASIEEVLDGDLKTSITVTADTDNSEKIYVRAALVAYWSSTENSDTLSCDEVPDLSEYINTDDWEATEIAVTQRNGTSTGFTNTYYVYKKALAPGETTEDLLKKPIQLTYNNGKRLEVTALMQAAAKDTFEGSLR